MQIINPIERNETFDLAYKFVTETCENIFLTGKAGTGKTTFLKYLKDNCAKNIIVAAPTGVAAINAGGVTLHSLFQLPFHPFLPTKNNSEELLAKTRFNKQRQQLLRKVELLIIDEISMVRCDTMDAIDIILKSVRRKYDVPFGGVQLLCIGDLYQLPPVAQRHEWTLLEEYYPSTFFFDSRVIKEQMPLLIELDKIYRQKDDSFVSLLNKVRDNNMQKEDFESLHLRYDPSFRPPIDEKYITLTSHNNQADQINHRELQKILGTSSQYNAIIEDDFPENSYPADGSLILKVGAQVMFLKNDVVLKRYFNGKIGVVKSLDEGQVVVECDGVKIYVSKETWENSRYVIDKNDGKLKQQTLGTFTQFPLRLAWAITIHKSQGLTFEKVMIDAGAAFSCGQVYVALSRCTNLDGIVLLSKIPPAAIYSNDNVIKGYASLLHKGSLAERFEGARQIFTSQLFNEIFSFNEVVNFSELLMGKINEHREKLNLTGIEWMQELKNKITLDQEVGLKFQKKVAHLMNDNPVVENNKLLRERINDAANHFVPKFIIYQQSIQNHPMITEHRETANTINEYLNELIIALNQAIYYLEYCKEPFSIAAFLRHKLKYLPAKSNLSIYAKGKKQEYDNDITNADLYDTLKRWRDSVCEKTNLPIYMVANRATLQEIATYLPVHKKDLLQISGFGNAKVNKYGEEIINIVEEFCSNNKLQSNINVLLEKPRKKAPEKNDVPPLDTKALTLQMFRSGKSITEIAHERNLAKTTIEGHLSWFVGSEELHINDVVSLEKQSLIKEVIKIVGKSSIKDIKDKLPHDFSYGEIRLVLASAKTIS